MVIPSFGSNAMLAKSRAMYGKGLTDRNYADLLACHTVSEVAAYLKTKTHYASCLTSITPQSVHREQLEVLLKRYLFAQYAILSRYEISIGQDFYSYFVVKSELEMVLSQLHKINAQEHIIAGDAEPGFIKKFSRLEESEIASANNLLQLAQVLKGTEYGEILHSFVEKMDFDLQRDGTLEIEAALMNYEYSVMEKLARKHLRGKNLQEVLEILQRQSDFLAITNIYRMKRMLGASSEYIRCRISMEHTLLSDKKIMQLLQTDDQEEFLRVLKTTRYGKELSNVAYEYIEDGIQKVQYHFHLKKFRFSTNPSAVMLCYFFLTEIELTNVIHIVEGIRYGMSSEEIERLLVGIH